VPAFPVVSVVVGSRLNRYLRHGRHNDHSREDCQSRHNRNPYQTARIVRRPWPAAAAARHPWHTTNIVCARRLSSDIFSRIHNIPNVTIIPPLASRSPAARQPLASRSPAARQPLVTGPPAARHGPASRSPRARQPLATGPPAARHGPASRSPAYASITRTTTATGTTSIIANTPTSSHIIRMIGPFPIIDTEPTSRSDRHTQHDRYNQHESHNQSQSSSVSQPSNSSSSS
jgi:hypothetical protein